MRVIGTAIAIGLSAFALSLTGCMSPGAVEEHYGEAFVSIHEQQTANPDAGQHPDDGQIDLDGEVVENIMGRYRKAQTEAPQKAAPTAMVGSVSIGGK